MLFVDLLWKIVHEKQSVMLNIGLKFIYQWLNSVYIFYLLLVA